MRDADVVILGAGLSGGLPAACYLQKAGLDVLLVEQARRCGTFYRSYELEGVRFDHSPVNFAALSPALDDLELEQYGLRLRLPRVLYAVRSGERAATFAPGPESLSAQLSPFSSADAARAGDLVTALRGAAPELLAAAFFTPEPDLGTVTELTARTVGIDASSLAACSGVELVEGLFESDAVRVLLSALPALNLFGDLLEPGQGALAWLWTFLLRAVEAPAGNGVLVDALERCFADHGGRLLRETAARELVVEAGEVTGVVLEGREGVERVRARVGVVSNLGPILTSELLGAEAGPLARPWRTEGRTVATADVVLRRPLALAGAAAQAPRVYLLQPDWASTRRWLERARTDDFGVFLGHLEVTQLHVLYGTQAGRAGVRVRFGTGPWIDERWEERRDLLADAAVEALETLAPGSAGEVLRLDVATPADHWRSNPAARHGNPVGGDYVAGQWLGERVPYRTGIPRLYASNGVWPPALSYMAAGYNAACVVAEDAGVREQPWWRSKPAARLPRAVDVA